MINKDDLKAYCEQISKETWFNVMMIEKDYYITEFFKELQNYPNIWLIFKGGTCLNKVYLWYYRLSEDIDFSVNRDELKDIDTLTNSQQFAKRKKLKEEFLKVFKDCFGKIGIFEVLDKKDKQDEKPKPLRHTFNDWKLIRFLFEYKSVFENCDINIIKVEISCIWLPKEEPLSLEVMNLLPDIFDEKITALCYNINEVIAEKLRCSFGRYKKDEDKNIVVKIAIRDLFDLYYMLFWVLHTTLIDKWFYGWWNDDFINLFLEKNIWDIIDKKSRSKDYTSKLIWDEVIFNFPEDVDYIEKQIYEQSNDLHVVLNETSEAFLDATKSWKMEKNENVLTTIKFIGLQQEKLKKYIKRKYPFNKDIQKLKLEDHIEKYLNVVVDIVNSKS